MTCLENFSADIRTMCQKLVVFIAVLVTLPGLVGAIEAESTLDSNTAVHEGKDLIYMMRPPAGFQLITEAAAADGYSIAFIPEGEPYDSATTTIAVTIFTIGKNPFWQLVMADTMALRRHFGPTADIRAIDSVANFDGRRLESVYINDPTRFIPNVSFSYFDGGSEVVIFELIITERGIPRFLAESLYYECILAFKTLPRRDEPPAVEGN